MIQHNQSRGRLQQHSTLFKTTTARLWNNEWNVLADVSTCQSNVITRQICISVTADLDLRSCRLIPVHLLAKMWRLSVTMTTASPAQALRWTISCISFIFPWPSTVHAKRNLEPSSRQRDSIFFFFYCDWICTFLFIQIYIKKKIKQTPNYGQPNSTAKVHYMQDSKVWQSACLSDVITML